jgi:hypothetical protein
VLGVDQLTHVAGEQVREQSALRGDLHQAQVMPYADARSVQPGEVQRSAIGMEALAHGRGRDRERDVAAGAREQLRTIESGWVAAPVGHEDASTRARPAQHVPRSQRLDALTRNRRAIRLRPGRHDDQVGGKGTDAVDVGRGPEPELDVRSAKRLVVVADERLGDLGLAWRVPHEADLAADLVLALENHHLVTAQRGLSGGSQPCGACADHHDARPFSAGLWRTEVSFAAGPRVLRTRDRRAGVVVRDAYVASDAAQQLVLAAAPQLERHGGVDYERARHPDGIAAPRRDEGVGLVGLDDPGGDDPRQRGTMPVRTVRDRIVGHRWWRHDSHRASQCRCVAQGEADVIGAPGELLDDRAGHRRVGRHPHADRKLRCRVPDRVEDRLEEVTTVGPLVGAVVRLR